MRILVCLLLGFSFSLNAQLADSLLLSDLDTFELIAHPLDPQFELRRNTIIVGRNSQELAATFGDPSRVLYRHTGISTPNDQANGIILRGLPSWMIKWSVDGAEILNPNHLSNAGTLTDQSSASAGGVLMFPFETIKKFSFHGSPTSLAGPSALAGTADFNFGGESDTFIKLGLLGMEGSYQSKGEAFKAHARYSTVGLLSDLGVSFGNEDIKFQDVFLQYKPTDHFSAFISLAKNSNFHARVDDFDDAEITKDLQEIDYSSSIIVGGLNYTKNRSSHSLAVSNFSDRRYCEMYGLYWLNDPFCSGETGTSDNWMVSYFGKQNALNKVTQKIDIAVHSKYQSTEFNNVYGSGNIEQIQIRPSLQYRYISKSANFELSPGLLYGSLTNEILPEGSANLSFHKGNSTIELSSSFTHQILSGFIPLNGINDELNTMTGFVNAIALKRKLRSKGIFQSGGFLVRLFHHNLSNVPIDPRFNLSPLNGLDENFDVERFVEGKARSQGVETMFNAQLANDWYFNANFSLFDLKYGTNDLSLNARNNYNYIFNFTLSKKIKFSRGRTLGVNMATHYRGGIYERYLLPKEQRLSPYFRIDTRLEYRFKKSILTLDIQNVTSRENDGSLYLDFLNEDLLLRTQLGMIPILSWQRNFN